MFKFPMLVIYAVIAFNVSMFTGLLQFDYLVIQSPLAKTIAWALTVTAWAVTYINRNKFFAIRFK